MLGILLLLVIYTLGSLLLLMYCTLGNLLLLIGCYWVTLLVSNTSVYLSIADSVGSLFFSKGKGDDLDLSSLTRPNSFESFFLVHGVRHADVVR